MAFDFQSRRQYLSEMNLTPLVDVVFVLLIIFMVTAPLLTQGVEVELPETKTVRQLPQNSDHIILTVKKDGTLWLDEYKVEDEKLDVHLKKLVAAQKKLLYLKADREVPYGRVVEIMGEIKAAGIDKIGVVAEEKKPKGKK